MDIQKFLIHVFVLSVFTLLFVITNAGDVHAYYNNYGDSYGYHQYPLYYESAYDYIHQPYWMYPIGSYPNAYGYGLGYTSYGSYPSPRYDQTKPYWYDLWYGN